MHTYLFHTSLNSVVFHQQTYHQSIVYDIDVYVTVLIEEWKLLQTGVGIIITIIGIIIYAC